MIAIWVLWATIGLLTVVLAGVIVWLFRFDCAYANAKTRALTSTHTIGDQTPHFKCAICGKVGHKDNMERAAIRDRIWIDVITSGVGTVSSGHIEEYAHTACLKKQYRAKMGQVGWERKQEKKGGKK